MFSFKERAASIEFLSSHPVDVAVIGAGAVGCSVAAHLAVSGVSCAVIEKEDIAFGASGNSTGLAHAGLRYLAQGRLLYVLQETRERQRLQKLAPHWVRPFHFVFPVYKGDRFGLALVRFGTWIYDSMNRLEARLHGETPPRKARTLSSREVIERIPGLRSDGLEGATEYFVDAQLQDSRFALGFAQLAHAKGAHIVTHAAVRPVATNGGSPVLHCEDRLGGAKFEVRSKLVINAAGAWIDELIPRASSKSSAVAPSQGIHLVIDRVVDAPLIFSSKEKGRVFFVLPYGRDASLVGTTETPYIGPADDARPREDEIAELLDALFRFFPRLKKPDFVSQGIRDIYWGLRPLVANGKARADATREHALVRESSQWWSVPGVKLTAARAAGEEVAIAVLRQLVRKSVRRIDLPPLPGGEISDYDQFIKEAAKRIQEMGLSPDVAFNLIKLYGARAMAVSEMAKSDPSLSARLLPDEPWIYAEAAYALREESVLSLGDLVWRRTKWAHYRDLPTDTLDRLVNLLGDNLDWSAARRQAELAEFHETHRLHRMPLVPRSAV